MAEPHQPNAECQCESDQAVHQKGRKETRLKTKNDESTDKRTASPKDPKDSTSEDLVKEVQALRVEFSRLRTEAPAQMGAAAGAAAGDAAGRQIRTTVAAGARVSAKGGYHW